MRPLLIFILLIGISSCTNLKKSDRLNRLNEIEQEVLSYNDSLQNCSSDKLQDLLQKIEVEYNSILGISDTVDLLQAKVIDKIVLMHKIGSGYNEDVTVLNGEYEKISSAINLLKDDISKDFGKRDLYDTNIDEVDSIAKLWVEKVILLAGDCQFLTESESILLKE